MERNPFVKSSVMGASALATGLGGKDLRGEAAPEPQSIPPGPSEENIGRPVRVVGIAVTDGHPLEQVAQLADHKGARGTDLIALPETCQGHREKSQEPLDDSTTTTLARLAKKHQTYIVCPIDRIDRGRQFNSATFIDRGE